MIIRSRYVKDDPNRLAHLLSAENNRRVVGHREFDRGFPGDLRQFLALSSALTATHPRAKITLAHFKISPSRALNRKMLLRTLARIRRENGISRNWPMRVVEHDKDDSRPPHFHFLFSAVDPKTGRVLSSKKNYARDELVSRRLEMEFGETITPGPRVQRNAADLRARGRDREAQILEGYEPVRRRGKDSEVDRQQATRAKMPLDEFRSRLLVAAEKGRRAGSLAGALASQGFAVAIGSRNGTLMAVQDESGMALPLISSLELVSNGALALSPDEAAELRLQAPSLAQARRDGAGRALRLAERELDRQIDRGRFEAAVDGVVDIEFSRMRRARDAESLRGSAERASSQAAMRRQALSHRREAARVERMRVERGLRAARILQSRRARRIAFALAAGGALLTGAGLGMALGLGVFASGAVNGYGQSLRNETIALITQRKAKRAREEHASAKMPANGRPAKATTNSAGVKADQAVADLPEETRPHGFDFASISKSQRSVAAMALKGLMGNPAPIERSAIERALGAEAYAGLRWLAQHGSERQRKRVLAWGGSRSSDSFAAEGALRHAGEKEAADAMLKIARRRVAAEQKMCKGRG